MGGTRNLRGNASSGAKLSGGQALAAIAGVAHFRNLAIDVPGAGYRLVATSGNLAGATSSPFDIIDKPARFDSLKLASTTVAIDGLGVSYTAWLANASGRTMSPAGVQGWIEQGSARRAAGRAAVINCGPAVAVMNPGSCRFTFTLGASNKPPVAGTGTLVPGAATARFELRWTYGLIATRTVAISLAN